MTERSQKVTYSLNHTIGGLSASEGYLLGRDEGPERLREHAEKLLLEFLYDFVERHLVERRLKFDSSEQSSAKAETEG